MCEDEGLNESYVESYINAHHITAEDYLKLTAQQRAVLNVGAVAHSICQDQLSFGQALKLTHIQAAKLDMIRDYIEAKILNRENLEVLSSKELDILLIPNVQELVSGKKLTLEKALTLTPEEQKIVSISTVKECLLRNIVTMVEVLKLTPIQQEILEKYGVLQSLLQGVISWKEAIEEIQIDEEGKFSLTKDRKVYISLRDRKYQLSLTKLLNKKLVDMELLKTWDSIKKEDRAGINLSLEELLAFTDAEAGALCNSHILRYCIKQKFITVEDIGTSLKITQENDRYIFSLEPDKEVTIGGQKIFLERLLKENSRARKSTIELYENPDILSLLENGFGQIEEIFESENSIHRVWGYHGSDSATDKFLLRLISEGIAEQTLTLKQVLNLSLQQKLNLNLLEKQFDLKCCIQERIFTLEELLQAPKLEPLFSLNEADRGDLKQILSTDPCPALADAFKTLYEQQAAHRTLLYEQQKTQTEAMYNRRGNTRGNNNSSSLPELALSILGSLTLSFLIMGALSWYKKLPESMNTKLFAVSMLIAAISCAVFCIGAQIIQAIFNREENKVPTHLTGDIVAEGEKDKVKS